MSPHDLVAAQTSNVCITHHAVLNAIGLAYIVYVKRTSSNILGRLVQYELQQLLGVGTRLVWQCSNCDIDVTLISSQVFCTYQHAVTYLNSTQI